jgi:DNA-binding NtrC family response regulator
MSERILFVDDDANLLASIERNFRRRFSLDIAEGAEAGLAKIQTSGPYAVVIADRQMPRMDGIRFLATVKERAPDTVRIMLTGNANLEATIQVVNEGNIFRFLTKPCPTDVLTKAIEDASAQYRLVIAEKELLNNTLNGSIKLLTDLLATLDAASFGKATKLRQLVDQVTKKVAVNEVWEIQLAAMLS